MSCLILFMEIRMKTYVYKEKEWIPTGRQAIRSNKRDKNKDDSLMELKPVDVDKDDNSFNIWVRFEDLYHVKNVGNLGDVNEDEN